MTNTIRATTAGAVLIATVLFCSSAFAQKKGRVGLRLRHHLGNVGFMTRKLARTPLPLHVKLAPVAVFARTALTAARMRLRGKLSARVERKENSKHENNQRVVFGDGKTSVTSSSIVGRQPSYGSALAQQHLAVINNNTHRDGYRVADTHTGHRRGATLEIHSGSKGWPVGLHDVSYSRSHVDAKGQRNFRKTSATKLHDGRWLLTERTQIAKIDRKSGQILSVGEVKDTHFVVERNGRRSQITKKQYDAHVLAHIDGKHAKKE